MSRQSILSILLISVSSLTAGCANRMGLDETEPGPYVFDPEANACFAENDEGERVEVPCDPLEPGLSPMGGEPKTMGCQMGQCCDPFVEGTCP